jgi:hypothetical protein
VRKVEWWEEGVKRVKVGRDADSNEAIMEHGIPREPPDIVSRLDWVELSKALYNRLMETGMLAWRDVQKSPGQKGITSAILAVFRRPIIELYKEREVRQ